MTEKITLEIGYMGEEPLVTLYGDERGNEFPKWRLTGLDGWNSPIQRSRVVVPDPNGGAYIDKFSTPLAKIITLNWSLFHVSNFAGWNALQEFNALTTQDKLLKLKLVTEYPNEAIVEEVLENCYLVNDANLKKFAHEWRFTASVGSKAFDLIRTVTLWIPTQPTTAGTYHGESVKDVLTDDLWYWWSDTQQWSLSDPRNEPGYTAGTTDKQEFTTVHGTIYWNINISAYQSRDEFFTSRGEYPDAPVSSQPTKPGTHHAHEAPGATIYEVWYWWSDKQTWEASNPKNEPGYIDGVEDKQVLNTVYGTIYWNINISAYQSRDEFFTSRGEYPDAPTTSGPAAGTYHGESYQNPDNIYEWYYWWSDKQTWETNDPRYEPGYIDGAADKQELTTVYGTIYWNINISAYQSRNEFFNARGEYPADYPFDYHGKKGTNENSGLFWDSPNRMYGYTDWLNEPGYRAGYSDKEYSMEPWAYDLYWNAEINYWQAYFEFYEQRGEFPA